MRTRLLCLTTIALLLACSGGERSGLPRLVALETGQYAHDDPSFSPDGRFIAFTARVRGDDGVYVADPDGRNARLVSELAPDVGDASWSPDSRSLVYSAIESGRRELYRVAVDSGRPVQLTHVAAGEIGDPFFSPDGALILFESDHSGRISLWTIAADGGEPVEVLPDESGYIFHGRWSPDGTRIAMNLGAENGRVVAVVDLASGTVSRLTSEGMESFQEWSPDGKELVYVSLRTGAADLWVVPAEGGELRQLTFDVRADGAPRYSPDGRWIAYQSERGGQPDLWVVPAAGGEARRVTNDRAEGVGVTWSPTGDALLFLRDDRMPSVYTVPTTGGSLGRIAPDSVPSLAPRISPDGQSVVYFGLRGGLWGIYLLPIGGGQERALVTGSNSFVPTWSPDGTLVAFLSRRGVMPATWVVSVESGEEWQISPEGAEAVGSAGWSPDGSRVGYGLRNPDGTLSVFTSNPRGGDVTRLLDNVPLLSGIAWSPDGGTIVLNRGTGNDDRFGIFRVPATGGPAVSLTTGQRVDDSGMAWSSDGARIAYTVNASDGGADVWIMNADGSGKRRLTTSAEQEWAPGWASDDSEVYFRNGLFGIAAVSVATGLIRQVVDSELRIGYVRFTPDDSLMVVQAERAAIPIVRVDLRDLLGREP
ncbi:MAG TPA: hypothetical protein VF981_07240 [Gemmatimonadaceae bacterium]